MVIYESDMEELLLTEGQLSHPAESLTTERGMAIQISEKKVFGSLLKYSNRSHMRELEVKWY
jgi:hypothetical protein